MEPSERGCACCCRPACESRLDACVWLGVVASLALWTAVAGLAFCEIAGYGTQLSVGGWVALTWSAVAYALVNAVGSVLLVQTGRGRCCGPRTVSPRLRGRRAPLRTLWLVFASVTTVVASLFAQFYSHFSDDELRLLDAMRESRVAARPADLDVLVPVRWWLLQALVLAAWFAVVAAALVLHVHRLHTPDALVASSSGTTSAAA